MKMFLQAACIMTIMAQASGEDEWCPEPIRASCEFTLKPFQYLVRHKLDYAEFLKSKNSTAGQIFLDKEGKLRLTDPYPQESCSIRSPFPAKGQSCQYKKFNYFDYQVAGKDRFMEKYSFENCGAISCTSDVSFKTFEKFFSRDISFPSETVEASKKKKENRKHEDLRSAGKEVKESAIGAKESKTAVKANK